MPDRRPALLGLVLFFCASVAEGAMVPFFPLWAQNEAGIAVGYIGLLFGCYAGGELIATPILGGIADRVGRRPVLIVSLIGVGCGFLGLFFAHGVVAAAVILVLTGLFECVLHPTVFTVIADTTPEAEHRRVFSLVRVGAGAGRVVGPALGALLALVSLRAVFLAGAVVLLLGGLLVLVHLPETRPQDQPGGDDEEEEEESLAALLPVFRDGRLATLLLWFMLLEVSGSWVEAVIPLYARDAGTLSPSGVGLLFTYAAALVVAAQMAISRLAARWSALTLAVVAGCALVLGFAVLMTSAAAGALVGAVSLVSLAQMLTGPLVPTAINQLAPPGRRATYMAAASVANDLRDSLGPASGTALYALAARLPWGLGIPLALVAAVGLGLTLRRHQRPVGAAA
ncbi:MAG: MFS transporter [Azospirillaceae bacterium]|nr:MFS transporter [Azospirillaceae bacterium]